jgi:hypothetical protein
VKNKYCDTRRDNKRRTRGMNGISKISRYGYGIEERDRRLLSSSACLAVAVLD